MAETRTCSVCWTRHEHGPELCPLCGGKTIPSVRLIRHQGELIDPRDTTSVESWGGVSWG
jgi:hypothetical protein